MMCRVASRTPNWFRALAVILLASGVAQAYINAGFRNAGDEREARKLGYNADEYYAHKRGHNVEALRKQERLRKATEPFNEAIARNPSDAVAHYQRGLKYWEFDSWNAAEKDFEQAIRLDPKFARAYFRRAMSRWRVARYEEALADYEKAVQLDPKYVPAYLRGALGYATCQQEKLRDFEKAKRWAKQACELTGDKNSVCQRVLATVDGLARNRGKTLTWQSETAEIRIADDTGIDAVRIEADKRGK